MEIFINTFNIKIMLETPWFNKLKFWTLKIFQLQLFLSLISLPILISWGLPISLLSPIGNIIFSPILYVFLLLSSFIFFFELLYIPNQWLIICLEKITNIWLNLLNCASNKYLITFPIISQTLLFFIPVAVLFILHNKKFNSLKKNILSFIILLFIAGVSFKSIKIKNNYLAKELDNKAKITIDNEKISITANGRLTESYLEYTLIPYLIKNFGRTDLENFVMNLNIQSIELAEFLINKIDIKNLIFLYKTKLINTKKLSDLIEFCKKKNCNVKLIKKSDQQQVSGSSLPFIEFS